LVIVCVDSMCARGWVLKSYSEREDACQLLERLHECQSRCGFKLAIEWFSTKINAADTGTRVNLEKEPLIEQTRLEKTLEFVEQRKTEVLRLAQVRGGSRVRTELARREREPAAASAGPAGPPA
jgi:hypothetical protein